MIIGLSGYARAGKNTVADILKGNDVSYQLRAFADPMREAIKRLNPYIAISDVASLRIQDALDYGDWDALKVAYPEVRRLLQVFGTEVGRSMFGENFWVEQAFKGVGFNDNVIFTDVRFPNEAQAIVDYGGVVWRISRPGINAVNHHPSENALDGWKFHKIVHNDGSLEDLLERVKM